MMYFVKWKKLFFLRLWVFTYRLFDDILYLTKIGTYPQGENCVELWNGHRQYGKNYFGQTV